MKKEQELQFKEHIKEMAREEIQRTFTDNLMETLNSVFIFKYVETLELKCKKQKEVIDKAVSILKDNFVYDYVRSCDTTDGVGYDEIDTEHFTYRVYEILKEVSE